MAQPAMSTTMLGCVLLWAAGILPAPRCLSGSAACLRLRENMARPYLGGPDVVRPAEEEEVALLGAPDTVSRTRAPRLKSRKEEVLANRYAGDARNRAHAGLLLGVFK